MRNTRQKVVLETLQGSVLYYMYTEYKLHSDECTLYLYNPKTEKTLKMECKYSSLYVRTHIIELLRYWNEQTKDLIKIKKRRIKRAEALNLK